MSALRKSIPGMIDDEKARKKADREADKIIFDIDHATRLEKLGRYDAAKAVIKEAADKAQTLNHYIIQHQTSIERDKSSAASAKEVANINKESHIGAAEVTANRMAGATAASERNANRRFDLAQRKDLLTAVNTAASEERKVDEAINKAKTATDYIQDLSIANNGKDSPAKTAAAQRVKARQDEWANAKTDAKGRTTTYQTQLDDVNKNLGAGGKKADDSTTPPPPAATRPSWAPPESKLAPDGNYYIERNGKFVKVIKN
jgi:hypothetical protein